jgi:hypothetical protein
VANDAVHKHTNVSMKTCYATTHQHAPREWRDIHLPAGEHRVGEQG